MQSDNEMKIKDWLSELKLNRGSGLPANANHDDDSRGCVLRDQTGRDLLQKPDLGRLNQLFRHFYCLVSRNAPANCRCQSLVNQPRGQDRRYICTLLECPVC